MNLSTKIDSDAAFLMWLQSGALAGVESLVLWNGRLTDVAARALAAHPNAASLRSLDLSWNRIGPESARGVARLAERRWTELTELNVRDNEITPAGVRTLISGAFPKLRRLGLDDNPLGVEVLPVLRSPAALRIDSINLVGCDVEGLVR